MQDAVDAQAVYVSLKFFSFFSKIIERNPPKFLNHRFSLEETYKNEDKANLEDNYFDKMLIDPPYGKETAQEGFGPEQGLIIAKKRVKGSIPYIKTRRESSFDSSIIQVDRIQGNAVERKSFMFFKRFWIHSD
ncbi:MAG: hypothetical protein U9O90_03570 [Euryarchaeota archaeon]|nr:hypothetical protein [Euryarchaeota archaeon]